MSDDSSDRIARHLRSVATNAGPGARLPSTRQLAARFGAGPVTVQRALAQLVADGVVETRPGQGTFVRRRSSSDRLPDLSWQTAALGPDRVGTTPIGSSMRDIPHDTIAMHSGYPDDDLMPTDLVRTALTRAAKRDDATRRPPTAGLPELRRWFVDELGADGIRESDAMITSGGQAALAAAFRALAAPGDAVVMESPTYWGAIAAARQTGLVIVPVPRTDGAPSAADLDDAFATSGARLFYAQPNFANPTGDVWTAQQRSAVLDVAAAHGAFVVEDDWAHDFGFDVESRPLVGADRDGHVVYIRSLTKSMSLTVRVATIIARGPARTRIENALTVSDLYVSPILQLAALDVVSRPAWRTHLNRLRRELASRRDHLVDAVSSGALRDAGVSIPRVPPGGLNLWVRLPDVSADGTSMDPDDVVARALTKGVAISPGREWFPTEPTAPFIRLNFGACGPQRYAEAMAILAQVI